MQQISRPALPPEGFVRLASLIDGDAPIIPLSKSTIYAKIRTGTFPAPAKMGNVAVWNVAQIRAWIQNPK